MRLIPGVIGALAATCLFGSQAGHAQTAQPRWSVDGSGAFCTLSRVVAEEPATSLVVRTYPGIDKFSLLLIRKGPAGFGALHDVSVSFDPPGQHWAQPVALLPLGDLGKAIEMDYLPTAFIDDFGKASSITVAVGKKAIGAWPIPDAAKAVNALRRCETAKLVEWGADPASFEPGGATPQPIGDASKWLVPDDIQRRGSFSAMAVTRLTIGVGGQVEACALVDSSHNAKMDTIACPKVTERARYAPAKDKDGKPVKSVVLYATAWRIVETITTEAF